MATVDIKLTVLMVFEEQERPFKGSRCQWYMRVR